jgi:hypothetical protein
LYIGGLLDRYVPTETGLSLKWFNGILKQIGYKTWVVAQEDAAPEEDVVAEDVVPGDVIN